MLSSTVCTHGEKTCGQNSKGGSRIIQNYGDLAADKRAFDCDLGSDCHSSKSYHGNTPAHSVSVQSITVSAVRSTIALVKPSVDPITHNT